MVIKGLPYQTTSCATCRRPDSSYAIVSFHGLQLGYRVKYKVPFTRTDVKIRPIPRASLVPCLITEESVSKAIGRVLSCKRDVEAAAWTKAITTITALRGHFMGVSLLLCNVVVDGLEKSFAGDIPHMKGGSSGRGWDPAVDGGASPQLVAFQRGVFDVQTAARSLALKIESAPTDLRHRVPSLLMLRVNALVAEEGPVPVDSSTNKAVEGAAVHVVAADADLLDADAERGRKRSRVVYASADSSASSAAECSSETDVFASGDDDGFDLPRAVKQPADPVRERDAPLLCYEEALGEPALATTGGRAGADRMRNLSLPLLPHIPGTAASTLKIMEFVRAIVVDPAFVWAPKGSWEAVGTMLAVLRSEDFSIDSLGAALRLPAVTEQRLIRGAVRCLGPGLHANKDLQELLAGVLSGLKERVADYNKWVNDKDDDADAPLNDAAAEALRAEMAAAHPLHTFSHQQYTDSWMLPPASVEVYHSVYGEASDQYDDYLKTGTWAPGLPVIRPMPGFSGEATAMTDSPSCRHQMGEENSHTGGTVGAFCTCAHPKCIGVMVLTGSESQLMPLEFAAQRFVNMPITVVYDFACATYKSALVRLPYFARQLALKCDRFHWRENHTVCSCGMCPDSYVSMDGVNTSSC